MPPVMSSPALTSALRVKRYFSSRLMLAAVMDNSGNVAMPDAAVSLHRNKPVRFRSRSPRFQQPQEVGPAMRGGSANHARTRPALVTRRCLRWQTNLFQCDDKLHFQSDETGG